MSSLYADAIAAQLAGRTVHMAWLAFFDFADYPTRLWPGFGNIVSGGFTWKGYGDLVSIQDVQIPQGMVAAKTTFLLSGVSPDIIREARDAEKLVKGRRAILYRQHFNEDWTPLDNPIPVNLMVMDQLTFAADGPEKRSITLSCETPFVTRKRPRYSYLTDTDQKARFPGDRGLEFVPELVSKSVIWPKYALPFLVGASLLGEVLRFGQGFV